ncbi:molybdenum cofactor guanylyltransferase [Halobaculum litoreum]|uniref:molybdenum cofactor guanylyltransferase n=1 Tax=Halobaculum litoreum TaxID=3031998 RepID=UPI0024C22515|nr:NTP transferase domain-containing protein [Halobaculum sp. DT92]
MTERASGRAPTGERPSVAPIVLAGGESRRFGARWKATATFDGDPLVARVVAAVSAAADRQPVVAVGTEEKRAVVDPVVDGPVRYTTDASWCDGPLAGIAGALTPAVAADVLVCCGCDMPLVAPEAVAWLARELAARDVDAVVPRVDGSVHPLHAAYDRAALAADVEDRPSDDRLRGLLERLDTHVVTPSDAPSAVPLARSTTNVNTPESLRSLTGTS